MDASTETGHLLLATEVAAMLRVSVRTVYRLGHQGRLTTVDVGPKLQRYHRSEVLAFINGGSSSPDGGGGV